MQAKTSNVSKTAVITNTEDKIDTARGISRQLLDQQMPQRSSIQVCHNHSQFLPCLSTM